MLRRVITSLIGVPLILICAYWGRVPFLLLVLVMVMTGIYEFYNLVLKFSSKTPLFLHIVGALIFPLTFYFAPDFAALFFFLFLLICYLYHLAHIEDFTPISLGLTILAVLYISYGFSHLLLLRSLENGFWLTFYVFITVWATDIGAYFVGINFGKHKLAPNILSLIHILDGVYDSDPKKNSNAVKFKELSYIDVLNKGLGVMDSTATSLCMDNKIPIIVFSIQEEGNIKKVVTGENIGTFVGKEDNHV